MHIAVLMASPFYGGPERQMMGLARQLQTDHVVSFLSFHERGDSRPLLDVAREHGFAAIRLQYNYPRLLKAAAEIASQLRQIRADLVLCCGYKPDIVGWRAGRKAGIPVVAVAGGWTAHSWKVRLYEWADQRVMRWLDRTVCVSEAQADKVRACGVPAQRIVVIPNAVDLPPATAAPDRERWATLFDTPPRYIVGTGSRLSPEKGIDQLVAAAAIVVKERPDIGFVVCGEGPLRPLLSEQIAAAGLTRRVVLAGYQANMTADLAAWDLAVLPSYTEGMPVFVLEAMAAGLPVVATAVGGTPEVVRPGATGYLVPSGSPAALAQQILATLRDPAAARTMGQAGRQRVLERFTFASQSVAYRRLFAELTTCHTKGQHATLAAG